MSLTPKRLRQVCPVFNPISSIGSKNGNFRGVRAFQFLIGFASSALRGTAPYFAVALEIAFFTASTG